MQPGRLSRANIKCECMSLIFEIETPNLENFKTISEQLIIIRHDYCRLSIDLLFYNDTSDILNIITAKAYGL